MQNINKPIVEIRECEEGYRLLSPDERVKSSDEYYSFISNEWKLTSFSDSEVRYAGDNNYRRPVSLLAKLRTTIKKIKRRFRNNSLLLSKNEVE